MPAVARNNAGLERARRTAARELSIVLPVMTMCVTPTARAAETTVSRSWSKLSWVRLRPMSTMGGGIIPGL